MASKEYWLDKIEELVLKRPDISQRQISQELELSKSSVNAYVQMLKADSRWPLKETIAPVVEEVDLGKLCFAYKEHNGQCVALREKSLFCNTPGCSFYKTKADNDAARLAAAKRCEARGLAYGKDYTHREE